MVNIVNMELNLLNIYIYDCFEHLTVQVYEHLQPSIVWYLHFPVSLTVSSFIYHLHLTFCHLEGARRKSKDSGITSCTPLSNRFQQNRFLFQCHVNNNTCNKYVALAKLLLKIQKRQRRWVEGLQCWTTEYQLNIPWTDKSQFTPVHSDHWVDCRWPEEKRFP